MRRQLTPLIFFVAIALGSLIVTLAVGNKPQYGLDLQGGISVVLRPTTDVPNDVLDRAVTIIRQRVDSLGVAEFVALADRHAGFGPLYQPTEQLREMAKAGRKFFA